MLISKLPTDPSPPKLSIFWGIPWPDDKGNATKQKKLIKMASERIGDSDDGFFTFQGGEVFGIDDPQTAKFYTLFGQDPNWIGALKIRYRENDIRVFPHEYSKLDVDRMRMYVLGYDNVTGSHDLVTEGVAEDNLTKLALDVDMRPMYEFALLEGCNEQQALLVTLGQDITESEIEFSPVGWYRCRKEYASVYCDEWEMKE